MHTDFHRKILAKCHVTRDGSKHWVLRGSKLTYSPEISELTTTKRAAYAAFRGEIPADMLVKTVCDVSGCISPEHAVLKPSGGRSTRALALPEQIAALSRPDTFQPPSTKEMLPVGLTLHHIELVKYLLARGNSQNDVAAMVGVHILDVARIRGGVYDVAIKKLLAAAKGRRGFVDSDSAKSPADISDNTLVGALKHGEGERKAVVPRNLSEEEAAWLGKIEKGF